MVLTGSTYRTHSNIMCVDCVGSNVSLGCPSSGGSVSEHAFHSDYTKSERDTCLPELNPPQAILPYVATASRFPSEVDITSTQYAYEGSVNPDCVEQPPAHVIDYWFHRLGLSLDAPLGGNPSDLLNLSSSLSDLDEIGLLVSSILVMLYHIHWCSVCAHTLRRDS